MFITVRWWFWHRTLISKNILRTSKKFTARERIKQDPVSFVRVVTGFTVIFFILIIVIYLPVKPVFFRFNRIWPESWCFLCLNY